jgi:Fe-Mn family superoxide dismutase
MFLKTAAVGSFIASGGVAGLPISARAAKAAYTLPPLPYPEDGLEPYISGRTISFHYGKHHRTYVDKTNELAQSANLAGLPLEELIRTSAKSKNQQLFNNAAQSWNHTFYWRGMKSKGGGSPSGDLAKVIVRSFGSVEKFNESFSEAAENRFGSGYAWLVVQGDSLKIMSTSNADTPVAYGIKPLLTIDVWEHAYYLDYQNKRKAHIKAFLDHLVNWDFVSENLDSD